MPIAPFTTSSKRTRTPLRKDGVATQNLRLLGFAVDSAPSSGANQTKHKLQPRMFDRLNERAMTAPTKMMASHLLLGVLLTPLLLAQLALAADASLPPVVLWYAPFLSGGGYCSEAHSYVTSIAAAHGDSLNAAFIRDIPDDMRELLEEHWIEPRDFHWRLRDQTIAIAICHSEPGAWHPARYSTSRCPPAGAQYTVGRTMFETDRVPKGWAERMNAMDEIWVPTKFQARVFADGGVRPEAIHVVPEAVDVQFFDPMRVTSAYDLAQHVAGVTVHTTVFLSIFKWEERKAWRVLLRAYFEAFTAHDDVLLVLLTNAYHSDAERANDFEDVIERFARESIGKPVAELPRVFVLPPQLPQAALPSLYKAASAFVLPSRGEGWGRPHVEAMAMALPVIATFWSGTTEYMTEANSYPLRIDGLVEIPDGAFRGHKWAEPSVAHLKELLVHVKDHPEDAAAKGKQGRRDMVAKYAPEVIGGLLVRHIDRILKHVADQEVGGTTRDEL